MHLGLGGFFRAHQAWYTAHAADAGDWRYEAYAGRSPAPQPAAYTLVIRSDDGDMTEEITVIGAAHPATDEAAWVADLASAEVAAVTLTITEAGYAGGPAIARLLAGLDARRRAGAGPLALVPCDNVAANGALLRRRLLDAAGGELAAWIDESVTVVSTVVDRITPRPAPAAHPVVVTEPWAEWVLAGAFPAGRPAWDATFVEDVTPYEQRKLRLLNGAHSLLAYAGSIRGHATTPEAIADDVLRGWVEAWWDEAAPHVALPTGDYRAALLTRFGNRRLGDQLARIAEDGSQKLPLRVVPVVRAERAAGRLPLAGAGILGAWVEHLRGRGAPVRDVAAAELLPLASDVAAVLRWLAPDLAEDTELVDLVDTARAAILAGPSKM